MFIFSGQGEVVACRRPIFSVGDILIREVNVWTMQCALVNKAHDVLRKINLSQLQTATSAL